jgi:hypothetical protein
LQALKRPNISLLDMMVLCGVTKDQLLDVVNILRPIASAANEANGLNRRAWQKKEGFICGHLFFCNSIPASVGKFIGDGCCFPRGGTDNTQEVKQGAGGEEGEENVVLETLRCLFSCIAMLIGAALLIAGAILQIVMVYICAILGFLLDVLTLHFLWIWCVRSKNRRMIRLKNPELIPAAIEKQFTSSMKSMTQTHGLFSNDKIIIVPLLREPYGDDSDPRQENMFCSGFAFKLKEKQEV